MKNHNDKNLDDLLKIAIDFDIPELVIDGDRWSNTVWYDLNINSNESLRYRIEEPGILEYPKKLRSFHKCTITKNREESSIPITEDEFKKRLIEILKKNKKI
jgi:hypothetical protein